MHLIQLTVPWCNPRLETPGWDTSGGKARTDEKQLPAGRNSVKINMDSPRCIPSQRPWKLLPLLQQLTLKTHPLLVHYFYDIYSWMLSTLTLVHLPGVVQITGEYYVFSGDLRTNIIPDCWEMVPPNLEMPPNTHSTAYHSSSPFFALYPMPPPLSRRCNLPLLVFPSLPPYLQYYTCSLCTVPLFIFPPDSFRLFLLLCYFYHLDLHPLILTSLIKIIFSPFPCVVFSFLQSSTYVYICTV